MTEDEAKRAALDGDWEAVARYIERMGLARHCACQEGVWVTIRVHDAGTIDEDGDYVLQTNDRYKIEQVMVVDGVPIDGQWQTAADPWDAKFSVESISLSSIPRMYQHQLDGCMGERFMPTFGDEDRQEMQQHRREMTTRLRNRLLARLREPDGR
jgi:hypothetical protein